MTDSMREEFEAYREERNAALEWEGHTPGSKWHIDNTHYMTWQASRVSLCVELPQIIKGITAECTAHNKAVNAAAEAITKAGVTVI
jgi:3-oxoacyl-(acyl-carrier-protein) synthase